MSRNKRSLKVLGLTVVAMLAMSIVAGAAQAAEWYVNGSGTALTGTAGVNCKNTGGLSLSSEIGTTKVVIDAAKVECVGATIFNSGGLAKDAGKLKFSELTVTGLKAGCTAKEPIETKELSTELGMDTTNLTSGVFDKFSPATGTTFATVTLNENCGATAGEYPVKGSTTGESANATGTGAVIQTLNFTATTNAHSALTFGSKAASLLATVDNELNGANAGQSYLAK